MGTPRQYLIRKADRPVKPWTVYLFTGPGFRTIFLAASQADAMRAACSHARGGVPFVTDQPVTHVDEHRRRFKPPTLASPMNSEVTAAIGIKMVTFHDSVGIEQSVPVRDCW